MPDIDLPDDGELNWGGPLRTAISAINTAVDARVGVWIPNVADVRPPLSSASSTNLSDGTITSELNRVQHEILTDGEFLLIRFGNFYNDPGTGTGSVEKIGLNDITVFCAIEINGLSGSKTSVFPSGVVIKPGEYVDVKMPFPHKKSDILVVWSQVVVASAGMKWPLGGPRLVTAIKGRLASPGAADVTLTTTQGSMAAVALGGFGPSAVLGLTSNIPARSLCFMGTSICNGLSSTDTLGSYLVTLARNNQIPYMNLGQSSSSTQGLGTRNTRNLKLRLTADAYFTHAIHEGITNDLGLSLSAIQSAALSLWSYWYSQGVKAYSMTCLPHTTDGTGTTPVAGETIRLAWNAWIRDGAPMTLATGVSAAVGATSGVVRAGTVGHPLTNWLEVADAVETTRNSGQWVGGGMTADGIHPTQLGHTAIRTALLPQMIAFGILPVGAV